MCAADSPYRNYKALCMNPAAEADSSEYQALACTHMKHLQMSGRHPNGRTHGEMAEVYTPRYAQIIECMHFGTDGDATSAGPGQPQPPPASDAQPPPAGTGAVDE